MQDGSIDSIVSGNPVQIPTRYLRDRVLVLRIQGFKTRDRNVEEVLIDDGARGPGLGNRGGRWNEAQEQGGEHDQLDQVLHLKLKLRDVPRIIALAIRGTSPIVHCYRAFFIS